MKKNTLYLFFILSFFLFFDSLVFCQEINVKGTVKNINNVVIESASVMLVDKNENVIAYTFTNDKGVFILNFIKKDATCTIIVHSLGMEKRKIPVEINNNIEIPIILNFKEEILNEVIINSVKKNDTTSLKVKDYINNIEQTVEDLLKKLPGIEVLADGSIKAYGKPIDKLLVEGDDILNKNYKLLSKNLDAAVVDEVQIISNFEDNPVLKKLFESEKVAINLKLKKNKQNIWFGNVNIGAGLFSENRWKESINLGLLRKKKKFFYFADYNNSGEKATDILTDNINGDDFFGEDRYERKTNNVFNINSNENNTFGKTQSIFNKALLNSLNFTTKVKPNFTLRGVAYMTNDRQIQNSFSLSQYNIEDQPIFFKEDVNYKSNQTLAGTEIEAKYYPNDKNYITNTFIYKNNPNQIFSNTFLNDSNIDQNINGKNQTIYNHFNHTFTLNRKSVINNYIYFGLDNKTNTNFIKSPLLNDFLNIDEASFVNQDFDNSIQYFGIKSKFLSKYKKLEYSFSINYENSNEIIKNNFIADGSANSAYENNLTLEQNTFKSALSTRFRFTKKLYFTSSLNHTLNNFKLNDFKKPISIFNFTTRLNYDITKLARFGLSFSKNYNIPEIGFLLEKSILVNYRSFTTGTAYKSPIENSIISFSYYLLNNVKRYAINAGISISDTNSTIGSENQLNPNFSFSNYIYTKGGTNYSGNLSFTKYVSNLKSSFKLETSHNINENLIKINATEFSILKNYFSFYKFKSQSYLTGPLNFDFSYSYNESQSNYNSITSKNSFKDASLSLIYKPKETIIVELITNYYNINSKDYYFTNGVISYNPKESKFSYRMVLNNLFDRNEFTTINISDYTSYTQSIPLLPRYLLLNVKYRF